MNNIKNKKGSTLVLLVIAIGVISLLGTSVLAVTMMNYKIKKTNTEIKSTFYLSESGLDKAYERAYALVLEAIDKGNEDAEAFIKSVEYEIERLRNEVNSLEDGVPPAISPAFSSFIEISPDAGGSFSISVKSNNVDNEAENIYNTKYMNFLNVVEISDVLEADYDDTDLIVDVDGSGGGSIWQNIAGNMVMKIKINSKYTKNSGISKTTSTELLFKIPPYNKPYSVAMEHVGKHALWAKTLWADSLSLSGDMNVDGDIYVSENFKVVSSNSNALVKGDLIVKGGKDVVADDDKGIIIDAINSSLKVEKGNVYTKNILLQKNGNNFNTSKDVYIKDDLEMNDSNQKVNIGGSYYGFSYGGSLSVANTANSAIIINSPDILSGGSSLKIGKNLSLFGVSYIEGTTYATGESLSIKGNYGVYTQPLMGGTSDGKSLNWDNVDFVNYSENLPPLAYSFRSGGKMTPWNKADYFIQYKNEYSGLGLNLGGPNITIDGASIESLGVSIDNGVVKPTAYNLSFIDKITNPSSYLEPYNDKTKNYFDDIKTRIDANKINKQRGEELVYIDNDGITIDTGEYGGKVVKGGIIVTNGDVKINGELSFKGVIISGGNVSINVPVGEKFELEYDEEYIAKLVNEYKLDSSLFEGIASIVGYVDIPSYKSSDSDEVIILEDYLYFENWKIE